MEFTLLVFEVPIGTLIPNKRRPITFQYMVLDRKTINTITWRLYRNLQSYLN